MNNRRSTYTLFQPSPGRPWHYRFCLDGCRFQKTTHEVSRAKAVLEAERAYQAALARSRGEEPCPTLAELVKLWLDAHEQTTGPNHLSSVATFGRLHLYGMGKCRISDITTAQVEGARDMHLRDHAPSSANLWLKILRILMNWAIRRRMIRYQGWEVKLLKVQRRPKVILAAEKTQPWLEALDQGCENKPGMKTVIRMAVGLFLRASEAVGARWEWLDWGRNCYTPGRLLASGNFKTKGGEAEPLPVPEWLLEYLKPFRQENGLIAARNDGQPFTVAQMSAAMRKANFKAGTPSLTPHRLRGTGATMLIEAGVSIHNVQAFMRHKDIRTTMGYLEKDMERVSRGLEVMAGRQGMRWRENDAQKPAEPGAPALDNYSE